MIQLFYGDWNNNPPFIINGNKYDKEYIPSDVHGVGNGESCTSTLTFEEPVYDIITQKGIVIQGHGVRLNKVLLANAATGIRSIEARPSTSDDPYYYTIGGHRITTPPHGLYIHNGKKIQNWK